MRAVLASCLPVLLAACSSLLGIENLGGPADAPGGDVPGDGGGSDGPLTQVTVSGSLTANLQGQPPAAVPVELLLVSNASIAKSGTADSAGAFSLTVPTSIPIDVALHIRGSTINVPDDYVYFPAPLASDRQVSLLMPTLADLQALATQLSNNYTNSSVFLMITILDRAGAPVVGENVSIDLQSSVTYYYPGSMDGRTSTTGRVVILTTLGSPGRTAVRITSSGPAVISPYTIYFVAGGVHYLELRP
jgi:hypothetical protein